MGFLDKIKSILTSNDYDDYDYEDDYGEDETDLEEENRDTYSYSGNYRDTDSSRRVREEREERARARQAERQADQRSDSRNSKIFNFHATTQIQVVIQKPVSFDEARAIADHINLKRTVVLNLENTEEKEAHRLFDFLSGAAYANSCGFKKIAHRTFLITPANVDVMGDALLDELENNGYFAY